jgi:hypothetical protein
MTEDDWLSCTDPQRMLTFLRDSGKLTERKARLFACACCRRVWHLLADERCRQAVEAAERHADEGAGEQELAEAEARVRAFVRAAWAESHPPHRSHPIYSRCPVSYAGFAALYSALGRAADSADAAATAVAAGVLAGVLASYTPAARDSVVGARRAAVCSQTDLLRDLFRGPPRSVPPLSLCLLGTVARLAQAAYEDRLLPAGHLDPVRLAVLADALEEAGCNDPDLLGHLRQQGAVHVRGCYVLDLLLGKDARG